jgi:CRISPR-associated Cas5-like protein
MTWLRADYEFASLFSYRIPDFSSQYALTSLLPGPSTIKLAIVSTAIRHSGDVSFGEKIFEIVRNSEIAIVPPKRIAVSNVLIRRLKKKRQKIGEFERTFGIRGYAHFPESLGIYIEVPDETKAEIKSLLSRIRQLGSYDSIVYCKSVCEERPPQECVRPIQTLEKPEKKAFIIPIKDINPHISVTFKDVNPFVRKIQKTKENKAFVNKFYQLHVLRQEQGKNWTVYEFE